MRERIRALLPRTRKGWRRTVQLAAAVCTLALLPATWMYTAATPRVRDVADVPAAPVAVVFGAGLVNGAPSPYLAHRLATAARLYRNHKVVALLVTGDNSRDDYNEPGAMRGYLVQHGVPADRVVLDYAGFDTWDSCARAKRIFGVDRAILVSQSFHIRRALDLCRAAGISAYGVGVAEPHDATWYFGGVREVAAASKAAFNVLVRPDPSLLGPKDDGIAVALRAAARS
ncbi:vancomycin high temperature exclusion protein [Streptantibioticus rubrisoli]|uniref:YdcF family protein n=1 Tax=Streptantibioticus rubrisoli TaxID=1387313 RepID=A0ABT1PDZ8_9ACTN|nr:ElyC/SanA/YdcF family protein [Streptantibioticus rubrisoli]MCQ4043598.1 YdcF family protein [Streptantibioticus rubrisoli]